MIIKIDYSQYAVISDFDGTISLQDSNDLLFKILGNAENEKIEHLYKTGKIGTREGFQEHFKVLELNEDDYTRFIAEYIDIDINFKEFCSKTKEKGMPLLVVSGGFINAISLLLKRESIEGLTVYANELEMVNSRLTARFAFDNTDCNSGFGVCGNCKVRYLENFKKIGKKVIFIGDGLTDRCAAEHADIVFAKNALAEYCSEKCIKYIEFDSFKDINKMLFA